MPEQRRIEGETRFLRARFELAGIETRDGGDTRVPVAISSEEPVQRWFGREILEHSEKAIDMARLNERGLPLLMDHDPRRHIGRLEDFRLEDGKLRAMARFSRVGEGPDVLTDVRDGIRTDMSVGYDPQHAILVEADEQRGDLYRVDRWGPLEGSFVAIPADEEVGVGRAKDTPPAAIAAAIETRERTTVETTELTQAADAARAEERARVEAINTLCHKFQVPEAKRAAYVSENASIDRVRADILETSRLVAERAETIRNPDGSVVLTEKEDREYSLRNAINQMLAGKRDGFEFEVSDEIARRSNIQGYRGGLLVPHSLKVRDKAAPAQRTGVVGTGSLGGNLRFTESGDFIEALRNALIIGRLGGRVLNGLTGNVAFPSQLTASTAYWLAELGTVTNSDITYGLITLSPKTLMFSAGVSRQMLAQSSFDVEDIIRSDFIAQQARELDRTFLAGTSTSNEPTGLFNTTGVGAVTIGANGGNPTWSKVAEMSANVGQNNGVIDDGAAFVTNWAVAHMLKNTFKGTAGFLPVWDEMGRVDAYPVVLSSTVPKNLTKGTSTTVCSALVFVGSPREILLGFWNGGGVAEVLVDPYSQKKLGIVELTGYSLADIQFRHPASFSADKDLTTTL